MSARIPRVAAAVLAAAAAVSLIASPASVSAQPTTASATTSASTMESQFVQKTNEARRANGLPALQNDTKLAATSRDWSSTMRARNQLYHDPGLAADASAVEPKWTAVGENVGVGYSVSSLQTAFMSSSGHRANILGVKYNRVGVGVVVEPSGRIWVTVRFLGGPALTQTASSPAPTPVTAALTGDFDGDGHDDVFTYVSGTGPDKLHLGRADRSFATRSVSVSGTYRPVVGDFDGDGKDELFWYGPGTVSDKIWEWNGTSFSSRSTRVTGDYRPVAADFDGDVKDDILWYGVGSKPDNLWFGSASGAFAAKSISITGAYRPAAGDLDGDGFGDVLLYGPGSRSDHIYFGRRDRAFSRVSVAAGGDYVPFAGDLDGDGPDDIVWYAKGGTPDAFWMMDTVRGQYTRVSKAAGGSHSPGAGDFDRDGADDILWFSPTSAVGDTIWWGELDSSVGPSSALRTS